MAILLHDKYILWLIFMYFKAALTDFWPQRGSATSCEYNTDISYKVDMANSQQTVAYLHIQQLQSNICIYLQSRR